MSSNDHNSEFDAIVVGSGVSGGWAAKELCEKGLKVLLLERGKEMPHGKGYLGEHKAPWELPYGGKPIRDLYEQDYPIQSTMSRFDETTRHFWNNDKDNPYIFSEKKPFYWHRTDVVGGRSLMWYRQVYRWSDLDFAANKKDGHGIDWPIRYKDIKDWYSYVEKFIGISGQKENLPQLPDGEFLPPMEMNIVEKHVKNSIAKRYNDRIMTIGRTATLTKDHNGRAACHYCGPCYRGCSTGSYFSSQSSTLPAAEKTGNLTLLPNSVVSRLIYDKKSKRVSHVEVINAKTKNKARYSGKIIFLNASTIGSTQILLNSISETFPNGLANSSGVLGHYLMDHMMCESAIAVTNDYENSYYYGNRPNGIYIPRFRNINKQDKDIEFVRGYGFQGDATRLSWQQNAKQPGFGTEFKRQVSRPGLWEMWLGGFGECLPYYRNKMVLDKQKLDRFGIPQVKFDFNWGENEINMSLDMKQQAVDILQGAGLKVTSTSTVLSNPGKAIHEMGTARMGHDPSNSILNQYNQAHDVANLFVTDGACMTSNSCVNPSITYMALTARAASYATDLFKSGQV